MHTFDANAFDINGAYIGSWKTPRDGRFGKFWHAATGARAEAMNLLERRAAIMGDERRSDIAKKNDLREAATHALRELGKVQRGLNEARAQIGADIAKLTAVPGYDGDAALATIDLAIAQHLRSLNGDQRARAIADLSSGSDQRMVEAVLRLPAVLTGLSPEVLGVIRSRVIERQNPELVREAQQLEQAAALAQKAASTAYSLIVDGAGLDTKELMVNLGAGAWEPHVRVMGSAESAAALATSYGVE